MVEDYQENYISGWVKIFRSVRSHWIWKDPIKFQWWIDILLEVNHSKNTVAIGYKLFDCEKGESLNSILTWAKRWNVSKKSAYNFLKMLENDSMIVLKSETVTTRLIVCNYDTYQSIGNGKGTQGKRKGNAKETQGDTNKNYKNYKNEKNNNNMPTFSEIEKYGNEKGYNLPVQKIIDFYTNGGELNYWIDSNGKKVVRWKSKISSVWFKDEFKMNSSQVSNHKNGINLNDFKIPHSDNFGFTKNELIERCKKGIYEKV